MVLVAAQVRGTSRRLGCKLKREGWALIRDSSDHEGLHASDPELESNRVCIN